MNADNPEARRSLEEIEDYFAFREHELLAIVFEMLRQRQTEKGVR